MRSRPKIKVYFSSAQAQPGTSLLAEARFESRTRTPVEFVDFALRGGETVPHLGGFFQRIALQHRENPGVFEPGERTFRVRFDLPEDLPPTHRGTMAFVHYALHVHVSIPWWPDLRATYEVPIVLGEVAPPPSVPQSFCTSDKGGADGQLYMEASIARAMVAPDDVIEGAVSFVNVASRTIRGVTLELVARENVIASSTLAREIERYEVELVRGAPVEGSTVPFRLRLPKRARPSFTTSTFSVAWGMEIRARCAFSEDVSLWIPMRVVRAQPRPAERAGRVLPVGRARRAAVWDEVSRRTGLAFDPEAELLTGEVGDVTMTIHVSHDPAGQRTVATYAWPDLGLDLHVGESGWLSTLLEETRTLGVKARLRMRARDLAQAAPFATPELGDALDASFDFVRVDDTGAELSARGAAHTVTLLEGFAVRARELLAVFAARHRAVEPPSAAKPYVEAWRAFAASTGARFEPGRVRVLGGRAGVDRLDAGFTWRDKDTIAETFFNVLLDPPLASPPRGDDPSLSPATREVLASVRAELPQATLEAELFRFTVPGAVADPASMEPRLELLARLARSARGLQGHGPFR